MVAWLRRTFGTLRWKLAASYVAVTLAVLLTLEALLVLIGVPLLRYWAMPVVVAVTNQQIAAKLAPAYQDRAPDPVVLGQHLHQMLTTGIEVPIQFRRVPGETDSSSTMRWNAEVVQLWLFDAQGRVITATTAPRAGQSYADTVPPSAQPLLEQALRGNRLVFATTALDGATYLSAAPVLGDVQGVRGATLLAIPALPSRVFFGWFLALVGYSMVLLLLISSPIGLLFGLIAGRSFSRRLKRLTAASMALAAGDLARRVDDRSADEIGQLARQFNAMADQLADNLRALRLLAEQNAQLAERSAQLAAIEERNRLARDLHDSVSQELFSLTMLAAAAKRQLSTRPEVVLTQLDDIQTMAQHALQETRSLIFALRPAMLDGRGLAPALRDLVAGAEQRQGLRVELRITGERYLPLEQEQALFRIAQEALANVVRHSGTRQAELTLEYTDQATCLTVRDHGRGFDPAAPRHPRALGIVSMTERIEALGGVLAIHSAPGAGTTVMATLPRGGDQ